MQPLLRQAGEGENAAGGDEGKIRLEDGRHECLEINSHLHSCVYYVSCNPGQPAVAKEAVRMSRHIHAHAHADARLHTHTRVAHTTHAAHTRTGNCDGRNRELLETSVVRWLTTPYFSTADEAKANT